MSEPDLARLLKQAADDPPGALDTDELLRQAGADRRRRGLTAGLVGLVAVAVVGAGASLWPRLTGGSASGAAEAPTGCPMVIRDSEVAVDYVDLVIWSGVQYVNLDDPPPAPTLADPVTTVGCSVVEITDNGRWRVSPMPWPDRTATFLPTGTELYALEGVETRCRLGADRDGRVVVYTALEPGAPTARPRC